MFLEKFFFFFFYMISIFFFFNCNSTLMFWLFLEFNMVIFIMIMIYYNKFFFNTSIYNKSLDYLIIQSISSFMFLLSNKLNFMCEYNINVMIMLFAILMKMGVFPMHSWLFKMSKFLDKMSFFLIITIQKFPIFFLIYNLNSDILIMILILNMIMGSIFLFNSKNLENLVISSSIYSLLWFYIFFSSSILFFFMFFLNYTLMIYMLINKNFFNLNLVMKLPSFKMSILLTFLFLIGLPPLSMFYYKLIGMSYILLSIPNMTFILIWISTFLATLGYFNFMYKFILDFSFLYNTTFVYKLYMNMLILFLCMYLFF